MLIATLAGFDWVQILTERRAANTILPVVEFKGTDAQSALRGLFRDALIGGSIAPDVQGPVTVSLRNVTFETALQNVTRELDATYRIRDGWFEVVRHEPTVSSLPTERDPSSIEVAYDGLREAVVAGRGRALRRSLGPGFEARSAARTEYGEAAIRSLVQTIRGYPRFKIERVARQRVVPVSSEEVVVGYGRPHASTVYYRDSWRESASGRWQLAAREETILNPPRRFRDAPLSDVVRALAEDADVTITLGPSLDRRMTVDLTGLTFDEALQRLTRELDLTYRIEGGVYEIVPRNGVTSRAAQTSSGDPTDVPISFVEFEKTDVRVALSWLFQKVYVGYRFDPQVRGLATVRLRNVTFEAALQNITRQAEMTYRIENGVYEVVPSYRSEKPLLPLTDYREIDRVYESFRYDAKPARFLPLFRFAPEGSPATTDPAAYEGFLRLFRSRSRLRIVSAVQLASEKGMPTQVGLLIRYETGPKGESQDFWDVWVRRPRTPWRLASSEVYYLPI